MKQFFSLLLLAMLFSCNSTKESIMKGQHFYDFKAENSKGEEIRMDTFKDQVVLVVNTASKCGFTPQFQGLEELYKKYRDQGFVVLGFPCNQFAGQDPGSNEEILEFCQVNYGVTFPMFSKIDVNRKNAHPLFEYLKSELPGTLGKKIKWNFTKFLISKEGKPLKRYSPTVKPAEIEEDILNALK